MGVIDLQTGVGEGDDGDAEDYRDGRDDDEARAARESEAALMGRMRLGEASAFREYFARFAPALYDMAAQYRAFREWGADLVTEVVTEVLDDVALRITSHRYPRGAPLGPYLISAFRNRSITRWRDRTTRDRIERGLATELEGVGQSAVLSACSAHLLRAVRSPDAEEAPELDDEVVALHDYIASLLSPEEQRIVGWLKERVSQREIAAWTGSTHGATRTRIHRLRARIVTAARQYLAQLAPETRDLLARIYLDARDRASLEERESARPEQERQTRQVRKQSVADIRRSGGEP